ncbi:TorF family putative porin [Teredinibacter sp. KSP-S5-2]|uniref:TorF family putative porin n=1 Tax=Teredinibacter sp. KSP-S5-2 TaxID=3034506 RepID=UPI002934277B|nr:TorF family putative porin [Teredinibacter sp. KSP-S5-2]WNO09010.1 TorF family putative porin [Teredinibacter sp. KSP-S5-2]
MKKSAIAMGVAGLLSGVAQAEVTGNIGVVSDYYFRGVNLGDAGVYAGLDFAKNGFFAGTWWIDDGTEGNDGMEADFYGGYGMEYEQGFSWSIGYSRYTYTYTNDYEHEVGLNLSYGDFSLDLVTGEDDDDGADAASYDALIFSYSYKFLGFTAGAFRPEDSADDYEWAEISVSGELIEGIDATFSIGAASFDNRDTDGYMVLDISKSFELFK